MAIYISFSWKLISSDLLDCLLKGCPKQFMFWCSDQTAFEFPPAFKSWIKQLGKTNKEVICITSFYPTAKLSQQKKTHPAQVLQSNSSVK